ncbi:hypothetical protein MNBD_ALPHA03-212 [hydrothermal vent metagenome]|uniref:Methyltransferase domain-containing protein n=1 Tax=hydrothermal vent metagenome TaxID=652676 RepID=A0A3B1BB69_9ZZZZ
MNKLPQNKDTYNDLYNKQKHIEAYERKYFHSAYYPLFKAVLKAVKRSGGTSILEVGCGFGHFALMLKQNTDLIYQGFDFSSVAVERAQKITGYEKEITVADATIEKTYKSYNYDTIVCTEVLEHIPNDLETISLWNSGTYCICSVPNYDSSDHVRYFNTKEEVLNRYGHEIDIDCIVQKTKPFLDDLKFSNIVRALIWNRYRPRRLLAILGFKSFDDGGWFVFSGRKK